MEEFADVDNDVIDVLDRGLCLEAHDIVKIKLLKALGDPVRQELFARVWNACRDMTGCVQMHFDIDWRKKLFGDGWNACPSVPDVWYCSPCDEDDDVVGGGEEWKDESDYELLAFEAIRFSLPYLMAHNGHGFSKTSSAADDLGQRYKPVVDFSHFLFYALQTYRQKMFGGDCTFQSAVGSGSALVKTFDGAMNKDAPMPEVRAEWSWRFLQCLLRCRYLFDRHVIKWDSQLNEWCLCRVLKRRGGNAEYVIENDKQSHDCVMIESCLHVGDFGAWLPELLEWLDIEYYNGNRVTSIIVTQKAERIARQGINRFYPTLARERFRMVYRTPEPLLCLIDYLMWKNGKCKKAGEFRVDDNFVFTDQKKIMYHHPRQDDWLSPDQRWAMEEIDDIGNLFLAPSCERAFPDGSAPQDKVRQFLEKTGGVLPSGPKRNWMYRHTYDDGRGWPLEEMRKLSEYVQGLLDAFLSEASNGSGCIHSPTGRHEK